MSAGREIQIAGRRIGPGQPTYVIAELSANHRQSMDRAVELIDAAADAGADAVKLQTYTPDTMTIDCDREWFRIGRGTPWEGRALYDLYAEASTPWEWTEPLLEHAQQRGIHLFSSPFDASAIDYLEKFDLPAYKIASFELVDLELIRHAAATGRPLIMSTGMATMAEIADAVHAARDANVIGLALLRCNSAYPTPPEHMDLRTINHLAEEWSAPIGLSDHTLGVAASVAAVALGANIIEKHLTHARADGGPDAAFSLEPHEFRALVGAVREAERALGGVRYGPSPSEMGSLVFRRSLFVVEDIAAGECFTPRNVRSIRPGHGLPPKVFSEVLGRRATRDIARGTPLAWELIGGAE